MQGRETLRRSKDGLRERDSGVSTWSAIYMDVQIPIWSTMGKFAAVHASLDYRGESRREKIKSILYTMHCIKLYESCDSAKYTSILPGLRSDISHCEGRTIVETGWMGSVVDWLLFSPSQASKQ